jgi:hypothetical protein
MADIKTAVASDEVERPTWVECEITIQVAEKLLQNLRIGNRSGISITNVASNGYLIAHREEFGKLVKKLVVEKNGQTLVVRGFQIPGVCSVDSFTPAVLQEAIEGMLIIYSTFTL